MPLTPAEVHNVVFKKPPIGKRGYDEEEVDAFLDIIEVELARLIEENKELKDRSGADNGAGQPVSGADGGALAACRDENRKLAGRVSELEASLAQSKQVATKAQQDLAAAQQQDATAAKQQATSAGGEAAALVAAREENRRLANRVSEVEGNLSRCQQELAGARSSAAGAGAAAGAAAGGAVSQLSQAERVLSLAQQAADEQTAAAKAHHEKTVAEAKAHQDRVHTEAKAFQEKTVADAQAKADQLDRESRTKATNTVQEAEQRANQITTQLEQRKAALEKRLEELRTFEHEYRSRLKSYLESQLRDLDASGRAEPSGQGSDKQGADAN